MGTLGQFRTNYNFDITYTQSAKKFLNETIENSKRVHSGVSDIDLGNDVNKKLYSLGFNKISLKNYQIRDLKRLLSLPNGANFSVQGLEKLQLLSLYTLYYEKKRC